MMGLLAIVGVATLLLLALLVLFCFYWAAWEWVTRQYDRIDREQLLPFRQNGYSCFSGGTGGYQEYCEAVASQRYKIARLYARAREGNVIYLGEKP